MSVALVLAGCASAPSAPPAASAPVAPTPATPNTASPNPPANVNLSGYPLPYRQGYGDGCATAHGSAQKDQQRFSTDVQYKLGWEDGLSMCERR